MQILDYSAGYPGARAIRDAGFGGVIRYLRKEGTSRVRPITAAELADMRAHGLSVALVYQAVSTSRVLAGRDAGAHDARWALAQAAAIGVPEPRAIYFAADRDIVGETQIVSVLAYLDGAASVLGRSRVGIYGEADVVARAVPEHAAYGWQTAAWSGGRRTVDAHLFQRIGQPVVGGIACDVNDVLKPDFGQLDHQEDDMAALDEEIQVWGQARTTTLGQEVSYLPHNFAVLQAADGRIEAKLDALAGALSDDEANIIAAMREHTGVTPEQHAEILRVQLPGAVLAALIELAKGSAA